MRHKISTLFAILSVVGLLIWVVPVGLAQAPQPDPRFGIVEAYVNSEAATEAGAGYTRIIFRWDLIQPGGPGDWKPANVPDPFIEAELAAGREVVAALTSTPAWASADGSDNPKAVPDMSYWEQFVRRMAQQYQGRIRHWIIWNEPDVWDLNHPGSTWAGTEEDYYRLLKTAYLAMKDVDPTLKIHMAGLTYFWDWEHGRRQYLDRLLDVIVADPEAPAHNYYFDGVVYHLYFNPSQTVDVIEDVQGMLGGHGIMAKEIWINETNAPPSEDPQEPPWAEPRFRISLEEQSAFVIQEFALAFAAGADRVEFYKLRNSADHPESIEPYGLLRADDSRRPAFDAYKVVTTYLRAFQAVQWERLGDVFAVTFDRNGSTTTVLWTMSRTPTRLTINAIAPEATLIDEQGNTRTLTATAETYTLELPGAVCTQTSNCFIGGAPRLLVEAGSPGSRAGLVPLVTPTPTPAPTPQDQPVVEATQATPSPTAERQAATFGTRQASSPTLEVSAEQTLDVVTATPKPGSLAQNVAPSPSPTPSPGPSPTPLPPVTPLSIFTPARCLILVIVGLVVFTVTYGVQVALWWRRNR